MLHTALATAPDRPMAHAAAIVAGIALTGAALMYTASVIAAPGEAAAARPALPPEPSAAPLAAPAPAQPPGDDAPLTLVFHAAGASYVSLADLADEDDHPDAIATPRHARPRVSRDGGITAAVASVEGDDVPAAYHGWQGRQVEVDDVCAATVVGFAVVARRAGPRGRRTPRADDALRSGHAVLAARLDRCTGSYARDASPAAALPR